MEYAEAVKKVRAEKPKDNFMILKFGYDNKILVPHKDGVIIVAALLNAERLKESYNEPHRILEIERDLLEIQTMSYIEYERFKIAGLLNVTPQEVKEMAEKANQPKPTEP